MGEDGEDGMWGTDVVEIVPRLLRMPKWEGEVDDSSNSLSDAVYHLNTSIEKNSGKEMLTIAVVQILLTRAVSPQHSQELSQIGSVESGNFV